MSWLRCLGLLSGLTLWLSLGAVGCNYRTPTGSPCPTGFSNCYGTCVDTQNNRNHCGICSQYCAPHEICKQGQCGLHCNATQTICSERCVDLLSDRNHCGVCGHSCLYSQDCVSGKCQAPCRTGFTDCFGDCVDTQTNDRHCGSCEHLCQGGTICLDSICQCPSYLIFCGGWCTDIRKNPNHCGKCWNKCRSHETCVNGSCQAPAVRWVSAGYWSTCVLFRINAARCWGYNPDGKLGYGDVLSRNKPESYSIDFGLNRTAILVSIHNMFACALLDDRTLKCWGDNRAGWLGYDDKISRPKPSILPIELGPGRTATDVSTGAEHICALLDDGSVKCWGNNFYGQLGYNDTTRRIKPDHQPIDLGPGRTARSISAGVWTTCALLDNGSVKCWGSNFYGQLGTGDTSPRHKPDPQPIDFGPERTATAIATGEDHTCALLDNGSVKCWGNNFYGQLGTGDDKLRHAPDVQPIFLGAGRIARSIAVGYHHACALLDNSTVKCWGAGHFGQLGYGNDHSLFHPPTQTVNFGQGRVVQSISAGYNHTCAVLDNDTLKCWGGNKYGQLGYGDNKDRNQPDPEAVPF